MKKSQAALEFLLTYGWAILVILMMVGALAYLGVLNPKNFISVDYDECCDKLCVLLDGECLLNDDDTALCGVEEGFLVANMSRSMCLGICKYNNITVSDINII